MLVPGTVASYRTGTASRPLAAAAGWPSESRTGTLFKKKRNNAQKKTEKTRKISKKHRKTTQKSRHIIMQETDRCDSAGLLTAALCLSACMSPLYVLVRRGGTSALSSSTSMLLALRAHHANNKDIPLYVYCCRKIKIVT